jgi:putative flippase GtrA
MQNAGTTEARAGADDDELIADRPSWFSGRIDMATLARQLTSFLAVGVVTTAVHYGVLVALVETWAVNPVWATTMGFLVAVLLSYLLNRRYTFDERPAFHSGLIKYYAAVSVGLGLNAGAMALLTRWGFYYVLAQVIASGIALVSNFFAARFAVFRSDGDRCHIRLRS